MSVSAVPICSRARVWLFVALAEMDKVVPGQRDGFEGELKELDASAFLKDMPRLRQEVERLMAITDADWRAELVKEVR